MTLDIARTLNNDGIVSPRGKPLGYDHHPRHPQQRGIGSGAGLVDGDESPRREAVAVQVSEGQVKRRALEVYELTASEGVR